MTDFDAEGHIYDMKHDMSIQQDAIVKSVIFLHSDHLWPRLSMHEYLSNAIAFYIKKALI